MQSAGKSERELIRRIGVALVGAADNPALVPFGDDMAALSDATPGLLWTVDMLMDGVDFDSRRHAWRDIGRKALAVNFSDCAAMAARPVAALCAVALESRLSMDDALGLFAGMQEMAARFGCKIAGGDTNSWDRPTVVSLTVAGRTPDGVRPILRSGARPGDAIYLTGPVGGSILGRHLTFEPRVDLAIEVARLLAPTAMIDISDGLSLDLWRICEASGVGAVIDDDHLAAAIHADARRLADQDGRPADEHALCDGEDFELIVVLPPGDESSGRATGGSNDRRSVAESLGLLALGEIVAESGLWRQARGGPRRPIEPRGWEHFRDAAR
ncbi:MAG: thiamine-phosphate kinase [Phycisphaerae bacterium]